MRRLVCIGVMLGLVASCQRHVATAIADADIDALPIDSCPTVPQPYENVEACAHLAEVRCERLMACSIYDFERAWPDMMTCEARQQLHCNLELGATATGASASTALACADSVAATSCDQFLSGATTGCTALGALDNTSPCFFDSQCKSGFCHGRCQDAPVEGGPCAKTIPDFNPTCGASMSCVQSRCELPLQKDAPCKSNGEYLGICGLGLTCVGNQSFGTCIPDATTVGTQCSGVVGQVCDFIFAGLMCNGTTCEQPQFVNVGEACDPGSLIECRGSICVEGTCVPLPREGEECDFYGCEWPAVCPTTDVIDPNVVYTCTLLGANCL